MQTVHNLAVSPTAITYRRTSIIKKDIYTIEYRQPRSLLSAIWFSVSKYAILIILLVGIPFAIIEMVQSMKYHRVIVTMKEHERGKRKKVMWCVTQEESEYIRQNF